MRKITAVILALVIVMCSMSICAYASEHVSGDWVYNVLINGNVAIEGYRGNDSEIEIPAEIDGRTVTIIAAEAFMRNENLTEVIVPDTITAIGKRAFASSTITSITIPNSVTEIAPEAFYLCKSLENIILPNSITTIESNVFEACYSLSSIEIPDSVTTIADSAFSACDILDDVIIPDSVTSIGEQAFAFCHSMTNITIPNSITELPDYVFGDCYCLDNVVLPDSITTIGEGSFFGCYSLMNITIPDSVTSIGDRAFGACRSLKGIEIPNSVTHIGKDIFEDDPNVRVVGIEKYISSNTFDAWNYDHTIYGEAGSCAETYARENDINFVLMNSSSLASDFTYEISNGECTITRYKGNATKVVVPAEIEGCPVTSIGQRAFYMLWDVKSITIPDTVTSIGEEAFAMSNAYLRVYGKAGSCVEAQAKKDGAYFTPIEETSSVPTTPSASSAEPLNVFEYTISDDECTITSYTGSDTEVVIPAEIEGCAVTVIDEDAFSGNKEMISVSIPDSVTTIGQMAFHGCTSLKSITIPDSVSIIDVNAFAECTNLETVVLPNELKSISWGAFVRCSSLKNITIPDTVTILEDHAFNGCSSLTGINIPDNVTSIGDRAFNECSGLTEIKIPDAVTRIGEKAFSNCSNLASITMPRVLTEIGVQAFSGCSKLTDITIPDGVVVIGDWAFYGCSNLTSITIPDGANSIGEGAFYDCNRMANVLIPRSVESIGPDAFVNCDAALVISGEGTSYAETYAKENNIAFAYITVFNAEDYKYSIVNGECTINKYLGGNVELTIPAEIEGCPVTRIGKRAFFGCDTLSSVNIPDSLTTIERKAFSCCRKLISVTIPDSTTSIGKKAFDKCSKDLTFYGTAGSSAEKYAQKNKISFIAISGASESGDSGNTATTTATVNPTPVITATPTPVVTATPAPVATATPAPEVTAEPVSTDLSLFDYVISDGECTFTKYNGMDAEVIIPAEIEGCPVTAIGEEAFYYNYRVKNVIIPDSVTSIGMRAFCCSGISSINIPDSVVTIDDYAFVGCDNLASITIPDSVTSLGDGVFADCDGLTSISIPDSVMHVGANPFSTCTKLSSIEISSGHPALEMVDGVLFDKSEKRLISYLCASDQNSYQIPDGTISIGGSAFENCDYLASITIPEGVTSIGRWAFNNCDSLTSITIPEGVISIGDYAFISGKKLEKVTIPNSVISIGADAFYDVIDEFAIYGEAGSYAEKYAKEHGIIFCSNINTQVNDTPDLQPAYPALAHNVVWPKNTDARFLYFSNEKDSLSPDQVLLALKDIIGSKVIEGYVQEKDDPYHHMHDYIYDEVDDTVDAIFIFPFEGVDYSKVIQWAQDAGKPLHIFSSEDTEVIYREICILYGVEVDESKLEMFLKDYGET